MSKSRDKRPGFEIGNSLFINWEETPCYREEKTEQNGEKYKVKSVKMWKFIYSHFSYPDKKLTFYGNLKYNGLKQTGKVTRDANTI